MSRQTDQLLLHGDAAEDEFAKLEKQRIAKEAGDAKQKIRLLQDLQNTPGFQLLMQYLYSESRAALSNMERTEGAIDHARSCGAYSALLHTIEYVPDEIRTLTQMIAPTDNA